MKMLFDVIGALALVGGIWFFIKAFMTPSMYSLSTASAIQAQQVYGEATYYGVLAIAAFIFAGVMLLATGDKTE